MRRRKKRLTVTVDPDLIEAGLAAIRAGTAESLSSWVNEALRQRAGHERRRQAGLAAVAEYERRFGVITEEEMAEQARIDRQNAIVVRGSRRRRKRVG